MFITSNVNFDNTLSVKKFAKTQEAKNILNNNFHGNEKQLYKIGNLVDGNGHGFNTGKIIDVYKITVFTVMWLNTRSSQKQGKHLKWPCDKKI